MKNTIYSSIGAARKTYSEIIKEMWFDLGITADTLYNSPLSNDLWIATYELATLWAHTNYIKGRVNSLTKFTGLTVEDAPMEITSLLMNKYKEITLKLQETGPKMNIAAYAYTIVSNHLTDTYEKYTKTDFDPDGNKITIPRYDFCSLDAPVSKEDSGSASLCDYLENQTFNPIDSISNKYSLDEDHAAILNYMHHVSNHSSKGELLALVLFGIYEGYAKEYISSSAEGDSREKQKFYTYIANKFYTRGPKEFACTFNELLLFYNDTVLQMDVSLLVPFLNYTNEDFLRDFQMTSVEKMRQKIYAWNNLAKKHILEYHTQNCSNRVIIK